MRGHREVPQNLRATFLTARANFSNSLRITSLADTHHLTSVESHPYKKQGAGVPSLRNLPTLRVSASSLPERFSALPRTVSCELSAPCACANSFICHRSAKFAAKPFRCHTSETSLRIPHLSEESVGL